MKILIVERVCCSRGKRGSWVRFFSGRFENCREVVVRRLGRQFALSLIYQRNVSGVGIDLLQYSKAFGQNSHFASLSLYTHLQ